MKLQGWNAPSHTPSPPLTQHSLTILPRSSGAAALLPAHRYPTMSHQETEEATHGGAVMAPLGWVGGPAPQAPPTRTGPERGSAGGEGLNPGVGGLVRGGGAWRVDHPESTRKKGSAGGACPKARKANWPLQPGVDQRRTGPRGSDTRGQRRELPAQGPEPDWTPGPSPGCRGMRPGGGAVGGPNQPGDHAPPPGTPPAPRAPP